MEILKGFVFDLQRHDTATIWAYDAAANKPYLAGTAGNEAWCDATAAAAATSVLAYVSGTTYYVVTETQLGEAAHKFTGTAVVSTFDGITPTGAAGIVNVDGDNKLTTATAGSVTFENSVVTGMNGTGLTELTGTLDFKGASGTLKLTNGNVELSGVTANINKTNDVIGKSTVDDKFSGTITTSNGFNGKFIGTTVTKSNTLSATTDSDLGVVYTITGIDSGQTYGAIGTGDTNWSITGTSGVDTFTIVDEMVKGSATLDGGAGSDTFNLGGTGKVSINGGADDDKFNATEGVATDSTIIGGAGNDSVGITAAKAIGNNVVFDLGDGSDKIMAADTAVLGSDITILGGAGRDTLDLSGFTGGASTGSELLIDGGADADLITGSTRVKNSTVVGGDGNDTIGSFKKDSTLEGGSGSDYFLINAAAAEANIKDYAFGEDYIVLGSAEANLIADANKLQTGNHLKKDGALGFIESDGATSGAATITSSAGFYAATVVDKDNKSKINVGWVGENPVTIDASDQNLASVITGTTNSAGDLIYGGKKADTIYAGANDSVYGGAGSDSIKVDGKAGVFVGLSNAGGADTVDAFIAGWDAETADTVYMMDGTADELKLAYDGSNVSLKSGSATMTFTGTTGAKDTTEEKILINGKKVDVIAKGKETKVTDDTTIGDYYVGTEASGIDMTAYTGDVQVDLGTEMFRNIATLKAGKGNMSVLGGKGAESLIGGAGATSLYGGAGIDTLKSGDGKTTFFANESSGKDVVTGFVTGTTETSDVINVNNLKSLTRSDASNFTVDLDGKNSLKVAQKNSGFDQNIQWASGDASGTVKIGITTSDNKFSYDKTTTNYVGGNKTDVVSLASGTTDSFEVWVDNTGDMFNSIEVYDFSQTTGDVLAAGKANTKETIVAGKGSSSLWGGIGGTTDVLQNKNGSATVEFFYGIGDGNDVIEGQKGDSVNLYNISLSEIKTATVNSNNVVFTTTANETVTVSGSVGTFKLADGSSWTADYSKKSWTQN